MNSSQPARTPRKRSARPGPPGPEDGRPERASFFAELKRRNVIRMAGLYLVGAWLIVQVTSALTPMLEVPAWVARAILLLLAIGFIPALVFSWVYELTPEGLKREREVDPSGSITPRTGQRMDRAIFALLALAVGIFAVDRFVIAPRRATATSEVATQPAATSIEAKTVAVLPLTNASGDKEQQYFSDGLSENLIIALSKFEGLTVIGRNSAFQFRDSRDDSRTIGAKLGVAHLIEGSVQRAGEMVRISAALINAATGATLWSERYDRPYQDLFALQDEITGAIANALKTRLLSGAETPAQSDRPPSGSLDAYTAYLQGKFYFDRSTETNFRTAIEQFGTAARLDPGYAVAWAELSRSWTALSGQHLSGAEAQRGYAEARTAVARALELDPKLSAAHTARAQLLSYNFDWVGAESEYRRALELAPNDSRAKFELGRISAILGRLDTAIAVTESALEADPLNARWQAWLAGYLAHLGRLDEARRSMLKGIELQPQATAFHYRLAVIEVLSGNAAAALAAAEAEPPSWWREIAVAIARQIGPDRGAADAALQVLLDDYAEIAAYQIAEVYAVRKEGDKVFEWLERAWSLRDPGVQNLLFDPLLIPYHGDPRFAAYCAKVGLPAPTGAQPAASGS